jgi:AcrR family transcriptional regulator
MIGSATASGAAARNGSGRLGRPPGSTAAATRERILRVAEQQFALLGYGAATNQAIAEGAGVTTSSIYHHFGSKADLYAAVSARVHETIFGRYEERTRGLSDLATKFKAVVDTSIELHRDDPLMARFLATSNADARTHAELHAVRAAHVATLNGFSRTLIADLPVPATAGFGADDVANMIAALLLGFAGLADLAEDTETLARAMRAFEGLVLGQLITAPEV